MIVVVPVDPPREGLVLSSLVETTLLTPAEARRLYEAATMDVCYAVAQSGGDLLVNYRDERTLPDTYTDDADPEAEIRALVANALGSTDDVRFEYQVGSSRGARIGNTVTHLLEREDASSVAILEPTAPLVARTEIDGAAMALRRHDIVLGPAPGGRVYFAGFADTIDFTDADAPPELATLARRAEDASRDLGFTPMLPTVRDESGLCSTIAGLEARRVANRPGGEATTAVLEEIGLSAEAVGEGGLE